MSALKTVSDVKRAHKACGRHFFDPATMRGFKSRVESALYTGPGGQFFVTSEVFTDRSPRVYAVRSVKNDGCDVRTAGDHSNIPHKDDARDAAKRLAKGKS